MLQHSGTTLREKLKNFGKQLTQLLRTMYQRQVEWDGDWLAIALVALL